MRFQRRLFDTCAVALLTASLAACQTPPPVPPPPPPAPECPEPPPPQPPEVDAVQAALAYAAELRARSPAELAREIALPAEPGGGAMQAMRRALLLSHGRTTVELLQASTQLDVVMATHGEQADALKPLAALIAARLAEQRRLMDNADKLNQQLRDSQRRNDQLNEKLEALKAIEQTLPAKPVITPPVGATR